MQLRKFAGLLLICSFLMLLISCSSSDEEIIYSPPWNVTATEDTWLKDNPYNDKHDGGWVYSAREDVLYAIYGNDNNGRTLYRIDHINHTSSVATTFAYNRHGAHPVIDDTGTCIYMPPSSSSSQLERYNTVTTALETLAVAPASGSFSHGAWKNGKLWIVLSDHRLYSYDPVANSWSASLFNFGRDANVAASASSSNLIYILDEDGYLSSYDVTTATTTSLTADPYGFLLDGNGQFTWFRTTSNSVGYLYAAGGAETATVPAIYDIAKDTWHELSDPQYPTDYVGHATFDSKRYRLYVTGLEYSVWYYKY